MKNQPKTGRSARRGNAKAPYSKYQKKSYKYGAKNDYRPHPRRDRPQHA